MADVKDVLKATYEQEEGPPRMPNEAYVERSLTQFRELLSKDPLEAEVQEFMERNPAFIFAAAGVMGTHPDYGGLAITQPLLPGFNSRFPDFMVVHCDSLNWYPTLIEIERPSKKLFTLKGNSTAKFNEARDQLTDWRAWLATPANQQQFLDAYGISMRLSQSQSVSVRRLLVYGRRKEWEDDSKLATKRALLFSDPEESLASFDRLEEDLPRVIRSEYDAITVKALGNGRFRALHIAPTFGFSPFNAFRLPYIDGLEDMIDANPDLSEERKEFLKRRAKYWKAWTESPGTKLIGPSFVE